MEWIRKVEQEEKSKNNQAISFQDYMELFEKSPLLQTRQTSWYLRDMFDYYGRNDEGRGFKFFAEEFPQSPSVYGQFSTQEEIYQNICNFTEEGFNNRFLLLVGPNGSSKTSLIRKIMAASLDYSLTDEGALYTFSWIFPMEQLTKGSLGLGSKETPKDMKSYANLEDKDIATIILSDLKDHPLLLIPLKARQALIDEHLNHCPDRLESIRKSYLYTSDLSKKNRLIYDALLINYKGELLEVLKHIRVERFYIDRKQSTGAVTIEPQIHVDARLQQITMDRRLANLPPSLQSLNLFNLSGENIYANRGILEYSDLLKRPVDAFKYLLATMETQNVNLGGILTELDIFFMGSSNELHLNAFKQHPDFKSFKGRFEFVRVPYLLNYQEEAKIYEEQIKSLKELTCFEPHALNALCLWSVMTRLRAPQKDQYRDQRLGELAANLSPLDKTLFLAKGTMPKDIDSESQQILSMGRDQIEQEYRDDPHYEGIFGISPRDIKQMIYDIAYEHKSVSFIEILEYLEDLSKLKTEYDFLNIQPNGSYHDSFKFIELIRAYCIYKLDNEVRTCLGLVDDRSYEEYIERYIQQVSAHLKGEKLKNKITGKYEEPSMYFIKEFEENLELKEKAEEFRSNLIGRLGAYYLDNPGKNIQYTQVFGDMVKKLKESFRLEQRKIILKVAQNLVFYKQELFNKDKNSGMAEDARQFIQTIVGNMQSMHGYTERGAINLLEYLIKTAYQTS